MAEHKQPNSDMVNPHIPLLCEADTKLDWGPPPIARDLSCRTNVIEHYGVAKRTAKQEKDLM
jgi:hypothetical protein